MDSDAEEEETELGRRERERRFEEEWSRRVAARRAEVERRQVQEGSRGSAAFEAEVVRQVVAPHPPQRLPGTRPPPWHLTVAVLLGTVAWLGRTVPDKASLESYIENRYGTERPRSFGKLLMADRSHMSVPKRVEVTDRRVAAVGHIKVSHDGHRYEHYYLGVGGLWFPLPYLPRVHLSGRSRTYPGEFRYGLGLCVSGHCVCVPGKRSPCKQVDVVWDTSSLLSLLLSLNFVFFALNWWRPDLVNDRLLCMNSLCQGKLWPLLIAPFLFRSWTDFIRCLMLLSQILEPCVEGGSQVLFLALYLGGSLAYFAGEYCGALFGARWTAQLVTASGCRGGLSSLLALLSVVDPSKRFKFSLYMLQIPTPLSPSKLFFANVVTDAMFSRHMFAEVCGHAVAFVFGHAVTFIVI